MTSVRCIRLDTAGHRGFSGARTVPGADVWRERETSMSLDPDGSRLGKLPELLPAADGPHMGINISRICSHLWPRASRDAAHRNSPSSASRAIARAFCPTVIAPCANANLSEADGDVDAR